MQIASAQTFPIEASPSASSTAAASSGAPDIPGTPFAEVLNDLREQLLAGLSSKPQANGDNGDTTGEDTVQTSALAALFMPTSLAAAAAPAAISSDTATDDAAAPELSISDASGKGTLLAALDAASASTANADTQEVTAATVLAAATETLDSTVAEAVSESLTAGASELNPGVLSGTVAANGARMTGLAATQTSSANAESTPAGSATTTAESSGSPLQGKSVVSPIIVLDDVMPKSTGTPQQSSAEYQVVDRSATTTAPTPNPGSEASVTAQKNAAAAASATTAATTAATAAASTNAVEAQTAVSSAAYEIVPSTVTPAVVTPTKAQSTAKSETASEPQTVSKTGESSSGQTAQPLIRVTPLDAPVLEQSSTAKQAEEVAAQRTVLQATTTEASTTLGLRKRSGGQSGEETPKTEPSTLSPTSSVDKSHAQSTVMSSPATVIAQAAKSSEVGKETALTQAANPPTVEAQTLRGVRYVIAEGSNTITVKLVPASLGEMHIEVRTEGNDTSIRLVSANAAVRDTLQSQAQGLREALSREGIGVTKLEISASLGNTASQGSFSGQQASQQGTPTRAPASFSRTYTETTPQKTAPIQSSNRAHTGSLNVFI